MMEAWAKRFGEKYMGRQVQEQVDGMDWKMASAMSEMCFWYGQYFARTKTKKFIYFECQ